MGLRAGTPVPVTIPSITLANVCPQNIIWNTLWALSLYDLKFTGMTASLPTCCLGRLERLVAHILYNEQVLGQVWRLVVRGVRRTLEDCGACNPRPDSLLCEKVRRILPDCACCVCSVRTGSRTTSRLSFYRRFQQQSSGLSSERINSFTLDGRALGFLPPETTKRSECLPLRPSAEIHCINAKKERGRRSSESNHLRGKFSTIY